MNESSEPAPAPSMAALLRRALPYLPFGLRHEAEVVLAKADGAPAPPPLTYDTAGPGALNDLAP